MARALCVMAVVRAVMYCSHESESLVADAARHFKSKNIHFERWGSAFSLLIWTKLLLIICFPTNLVLKTAPALQWHIFTVSRETTQLPDHIQQMWATIHLSKLVKSYPCLCVRWEAEKTVYTCLSGSQLALLLNLKVLQEKVKTVISLTQGHLKIIRFSSYHHQRLCKAVDLIHHYCWTAEN